jgi:hypothetical protein
MADWQYRDRSKSRDRIERVCGVGQRGQGGGAGAAAVAFRERAW